LTTVVLGGAGFISVIHPVIGTGGQGEVTLAEVLSGRAEGIDAGSVDAMLAVGEAVLLQNNLAALVIALLVDFSVAVVFSRRTDCGMAEPLLAVVSAGAWLGGVGGTILAADAPAEVIQAEEGVGGTGIVDTLALLAGLLLLRTVLQDFEGLSCVVALGHLGSLAEKGCGRADSLHALPILAEESVAADLGLGPAGAIFLTEGDRVSLTRGGGGGAHIGYTIPFVAPVGFVAVGGLEALGAEA